MDSFITLPSLESLIGLPDPGPHPDTPSVSTPTSSRDQVAEEFDMVDYEHAGSKSALAYCVIA